MQGVLGQTGRIFRTILDVVLPPVCYVCKEPCASKYGLCDSCLNNIYRVQPARKPEKTDLLDAAWSSCHYKDTIKECIHLFKYAGHAGLVDVFRDISVSFMRKNSLEKDIDLIVPVPTHKVKKRERALDHAELLARSISQELSIPVDYKNLKKIRWTRPQSELDREKRLVNLRGSFLAVDKKVFLGKNILIVDDVYTTGSTVNECARALKEAGSNKVFALTIAR